MTRRDEVLDAALAVLGTDGLRQLTHRRVDREAGLAEGSTSNLFRTRAALLHGLADRLVEHDLERWNAVDAGSPDPPLDLRGPTGVTDLERLVPSVAEWITRSIGPNRVQTAARYALFLAAAHDPALRPPLQRARERLLTWAADLLPRVPASTLTDVFDAIDGLTLHQICLPRPDFDPVPAVRAILRGAGQEASTR